MLTFGQHASAPPMGERVDAMSARDVVSPLVGLVTELDELLPSPDDARQFHVVAAPAAAALTLGRAAAVPGQPGSGYGVDRRRVQAAAIGEAVERYSAGFVPEEELVTATARELGPTAAAPASFALFAPEQHATPGFPFAPFTADTRLRWVRARLLADGTDAWLPAQLVYLGFLSDEPLIGYSTSNGLAAALDWHTALLAALLELVERDAFMLAWNARLSFPRLDWSSCGVLRRYYDRYLAPARARLSAVDLSAVHHVPVVLAIVRGQPGALVVGAAAAPRLEEAWRKAVTEAYAVRKAARESVLREPRNPFAAGFDDVCDFTAHVNVYAYEENAHRADFLDASAEPRPADGVAPLAGATAADKVATVVAGLADAGIDTYAVDVTSPDVREAGFTVVRVVAPRLIPLDVRHDARFLGGERLYTAPADLGLRDRRLGFADLNPDPHPFP
jgi:ribosomal protein S12 methylthiotransferase accessory factor